MPARLSAAAQNAAACTAVRLCHMWIEWNPVVLVRHGQIPLFPRCIDCIVTATTVPVPVPVPLCHTRQHSSFGLHVIHRQCIGVAMIR